MASLQLLPLDWLQQLPVFPLPGAVFFPGTMLPLHVFEPRYRAMVRDCLSTARPAIAVTLLKPGYEASYDGCPAIHTLCTVGRIENHEELADGRFNLTLRGIARVRLDELPFGSVPYRRARAEQLDSGRNADRVSRDAITTLLSTAALVAATVRRSHPSFTLGAQADTPPHHLADTLADRLLADPAARQEILEALDVPERIRRTTEHVATLLGQIESSAYPKGGRDRLQ